MELDVKKIAESIIAGSVNAAEDYLAACEEAAARLEEAKARFIEDADRKIEEAKDAVLALSPERDRLYKEIEEQKAKLGRALIKKRTAEADACETKIRDCEEQLRQIDLRESVIRRTKINGSGDLYAEYRKAYEECEDIRRQDRKIRREVIEGCQKEINRLEQTKDSAQYGICRALDRITPLPESCSDLMSGKEAGELIDGIAEQRQALAEKLKRHEAAAKQKEEIRKRVQEDEENRIREDQERRTAVCIHEYNDGSRIMKTESGKTYREYSLM